MIRRDETKLLFIPPRFILQMRWAHQNICVPLEPICISLQNISPPLRLTKPSPFMSRATVKATVVAAGSEYALLVLQCAATFYGDGTLQSGAAHLVDRVARSHHAVSRMYAAAALVFGLPHYATPNAFATHSNLADLVLLHGVAKAFELCHDAPPSLYPPLSEIYHAIGKYDAGGGATVSGDAEPLEVMQFFVALHLDYYYAYVAKMRGKHWCRILSPSLARSASLGRLLR